ncbi:MAG: SCO family protein [Phycisphaerales bacterium]|nr:SCO family protein [Phycisphaerales bacterium]
MTFRRTGFGLALALILALALALGWVLGQWWLRPPSSPPLDIAGIYLPDAQPLPTFRLVAQNGQPFIRDDLIGHWTFLYFGYSYCPDACPLALVDLNRLQQRLVETGVDDEVRYLFVTVDPQRDTPERLREYVRYFNPKFQGATGSSEEINGLTKALHVFYQRVENPEHPEYYIMDHSSTISLIDPQARLRAIFTPPQDSARMATDFLKIRTIAP